MANKEHHDYGALVGWTSTRTDDRIALHLHSVSKPPPHAQDDIQSRIFLMDRNQAMQLANFLFEMGDTSKPSKRGRSAFARLFG